MDHSMRNRRWAKVLAWSLGLVGVGMAGGLILIARAAQTPSDLKLDKDVAYRMVAGKVLGMDIVRPAEQAGPLPVILFIHGGGWQAGNKRDGLQTLYGLAKQGYVAASVQYRLAPDSHFPAQIHDVKAAVRYVRSHAQELNIDPDRIGIMGGSAGAHLALLLATTDRADGLEGTNEGDEVVSSRVQAVFSVAGPTDLTPVFPKSSEYMVNAFIGQTRADAPDQYAKASPIHYVSAGDTPIFAVHGTKDELVPYEQVPAMVAACQKAGVSMELITIEDGGHGGGGKPEDWANAVVKAVEFFNRNLKDKKPANP